MSLSLVDGLHVHAGSAGAGEPVLSGPLRQASIQHTLKGQRNGASQARVDKESTREGEKAGGAGPRTHPSSIYFASKLDFTAGILFQTCHLLRRTFQKLSKSES